MLSSLDKLSGALTPVKTGPVLIDFLSPYDNKLIMKHTLIGQCQHLDCDIINTIQRLLYAVSRHQFGYVANEDETAFLPIHLIDQLPFARKGLLLQHSLTLLFYIYIRVNGLKSNRPGEGHITIPDAHMNHVFGKDIALYYQNGYLLPKTLMSTSDKKMTTYDVMRNRSDYKFNSHEIENYFFQLFISFNIYNVNDLDDETKQVLKDPSIRQALREEYRLIEKANNLC